MIAESPVGAIVYMPKTPSASIRTASKPPGGRRTDVPVDAHRRPLLDDRRAGGLGCLLGRALLSIDRAASDGPLLLNPLSTQNTLMVRFGSHSAHVLSERREPGGVG